jgi:hypothetical protein
MPYTIEITGVTGTPPYSISVCDSTYTYCYLVTGSTTIPPTFTFDVPAPLDGVNNLIVKIIDSTGCEYFEPYSCPPTPTPTPTITPTPTPTPTDLCYCITVVNSGMTDGTFDYIDCDSVLQETVVVSSGVTYYVCGWNPTNVVNLSVSVGSYCFGGTCPPPTPTPTPTNTTTPTPTPSPLIVVCFTYTYSSDSYFETINNTGYYNGKPYYSLTYGYVWYNTGTSLWIWSTILGGGTTLDTLNNGGLFYPNGVSPYSWGNTNSPIDFMSGSEVGGCA